MSVARRTPSGIAIITLRSTTAIDCSSFSMSHRRVFSAALSGACCCARTTSAALKVAMNVATLICRMCVVIGASRHGLKAVPYKAGIVAPGHVGDGL